MRIIKYEAAPVLSRRTQGFILATVGAIAFSGKAIVAKLMYRYGVDAFTVVGLRMALALPFFAAMAWWSGRAVDGKAPQGFAPGESPRVLRRLQHLRRWSHEEVKQVLT